MAPRAMTGPDLASLAASSARARAAAPKVAAERAAASGYAKRTLEEYVVSLKKMGRSFDPRARVRFDLLKGSVSTAGERVVLLPVAALEEVVKAGGETAGTAVGLMFGTSCGRRVAARLGGVAQVNAAALEAIIYELNGEISLSGLGSLSLERWGKAMVLVVEGAAASSDRLISATIEGALLTATGRDVGCVALSRDEAERVRVLVTSRSNADRVREWLAGGIPWGDALARLQGASP
jgi:hypothetical protein